MFFFFLFVFSDSAEVQGRTLNQNKRCILRPRPDGISQRELWWVTSLQPPPHPILGLHNPLFHSGPTVYSISSTHRTYPSAVVRLCLCVCVCRKIRHSAPRCDTQHRNFPYDAIVVVLSMAINTSADISKKLFCFRVCFCCHFIKTQGPDYHRRQTYYKDKTILKLCIFTNCMHNLISDR